MRKPLFSFFSSLVQSIKAEMADRRRAKAARRIRAQQPVEDKKPNPVRPAHRSKSARQARKVTRNRG